jgi:hypothetical protein
MRMFIKSDEKQLHSLKMIEFIKPLDEVKIRRKTITFTKDKKGRTVFINKKINSGIMRMFILFFIILYLYIPFC